jgi:hypothetical protein
MFAHALEMNNIEIVYYDVPVLQFQKISSLERVVEGTTDISDDLLASLTDISSVSPTVESLDELSSSMARIDAGDGKLFVDYVSLPFLRCKDDMFLFHNNSPLVYIRPQYVTMYDYLIHTAASCTETDPVNSFILGGNSGVGKSCFIYYFMYRLHKAGRSFRGYNCGRQGVFRNSIPIVASDPGKLLRENVINWIIEDSTNSTCDLGDNLFKPHRLYVNSDSTRLVDHQSILKDNSEFCFCAFTQWSYVDTCAAAFCPVEIVGQLRKISESMLSTTPSPSWPTSSPSAALLESSTCSEQYTTSFPASHSLYRPMYCFSVPYPRSVKLRCSGHHPSRTNAIHLSLINPWTSLRDRALSIESLRRRSLFGTGLLCGRAFLSPPQRTGMTSHRSYM